MKRIRIRFYVTIALFAALTAIGGFLRIPFSPIPLTMQTFFVFLSGDILGKKAGAASQALFLIIGLLGVPIFSLGGGPGYIFQPTFGYLISFPISAWLIGVFTERRDFSEDWKHFFWANGVGLLIIYLFGLTYIYINLVVFAGQNHTWVKLVWSGAIIFLPGDILKMALAAAIAVRLKRVTG